MADGNGNQSRRPFEFFIGRSQYFLRNRNFNGCRKHALRAREHDPDDPRVEQILAVADVIDASTTIVNNNNNNPDWYAILRLNRFSKDTQLIRTNFKNLLVLLNPNKNKFPLANDAFKLVCDAWVVLGNPSKHSQFDSELRIQGDLGTEEILKQGNWGIEDTFWTMCPYCYFVYEFEKVYEECCLKCRNCRRGFHAVAVPSAPPPEVVRKGEYWCFGFRPLGFEGDERKRVSAWTPFAPICAENGKNRDREEVECGVQNNLAEIFQTELNNVVKPSSKRRKTVARNARKLMRKGLRIIEQETGDVSPVQSSEEEGT